LNNQIALLLLSFVSIILFAIIVDGTNKATTPNSNNAAIIGVVLSCIAFLYGWVDDTVPRK
jgi:cytochrome bd-type quinol oxidase subunit 1